MPLGVSLSFSNFELDPRLLLTPYQQQTNWIVITGAPSCGKTTLINYLAKNGFKTSPEFARQYIEKEFEKGRSITEQNMNIASRQTSINSYILDLEAQLPVNELYFLDRGFPDALGYSRIAGLDPNQFLADCFQRRYVAVFLLERLPFKDDGVRFEGESGAEFLHKWLIRDYNALGYELVRIPPLPIEERLAFLLSHLPSPKQS